MSAKALRQSLLTMILLSMVTLTWYTMGMNRVYTLDESAVLEHLVLSDSNHGGNSSAKFHWQQNSGILSCEIGEQYQWPYCEVSFLIRRQDNPLDLSSFSFARLEIYSEGAGPQNIKVYLRNYNPEYSSSTKDNSLKINQIQYDASKEKAVLDIPLNTFVVPAWWLNGMGLSSLQAAQEIDRIQHIEIATGDFREPGPHTLRIENIEFHGKWLSYSQLVSALLITWLAYALLLVASSSAKIKKKIASERRTKEALLDINQALSLEKLELQEQAQRDHLTGVYNRFGLRKHLVDALAKQTSGAAPLTLILIDIDHFKKINDQYGHNVGDTVLKEFCHLLSTSTRESDIFGRWGGEEFILLCPESRLEQSYKLAENLRLKLNSAQWPEGIQLTGSFGVAEIKPNESITSVLKRADEALYRAKDGGRNCVECDK